MHMHEEDTTIANSKYLVRRLCQARSVLHNKYAHAHAQRTAARCTELYGRFYTGALGITVLSTAHVRMTMYSRTRSNKPIAHRIRSYQ